MGRRSTDAVDPENEEPDSDDEWQRLLETMEPVPVQLKSPLTLLCNPDFCQRIQSQLRGTGEQVTSRRFCARGWDGQMSEMTSCQKETGAVLFQLFQGEG